MMLNWLKTKYAVALNPNDLYPIASGGPPVIQTRKILSVVIFMIAIQACASSGTQKQASSNRTAVKFDHAKYCANVQPRNILHRYYYAAGYGVQVNRGVGIYRGEKFACYGGQVHDGSGNCPGLANPFCLVNWTSLDTGVDESEVKILLGAPTSISLRTWYYSNIGSVTFDRDSKKVSGYKKPNDDAYWFLGPIENGETRSPVALLASKCPPNGFAACKSNWDLIRQGTVKEEVERLLGPADGIEIKSQSANLESLDETWIYPNLGTVRMLGAKVISYKKPSGYRYLNSAN